MIRLFASDLDGTLLNEHHECDEKIEKGIQKIIDAGKIFTVATGRGIKMVNLKKSRRYQLLYLFKWGSCTRSKKTVVAL